MPGSVVFKLFNCLLLSVSYMMQTKSDLEEQLRVQIKFLIKSSKEYDNGDTDEAKRLATHIMTLVYDYEPPVDNSKSPSTQSNVKKKKDASKSLLKMLKMKNMEYLDTSYNIRPSGFVPQFGLVGILRDKEQKTIFFPPLDDNKKDVEPHARPYVKVLFGRWWNKTIIIDQEGNQFSREIIAKWMRNKDGGAHIDEELGDTYTKLTRLDSMGLGMVGEDQSVEAAKFIEMASIRQMSHELIISLNDAYPEYFIDMKYEPKKVNERFDIIPSRMAITKRV